MARIGVAIVLATCAASCAAAPKKKADGAAVAAAPAAVLAPPVAAPAPVRGITTPLPGDPTADALVAARLEPETCEEASTAGVPEKIAEMNAAIDAAFKEWHDEQPSCWESMREESRWRKRGMSMREDLSGAISQGGGAGGVVGGQVGGVLSGMHASAPTPAPAKSPAARGAASRTSATNNQVANVDEADIVKTDGRYMYLATNGALRIFDAQRPHEVSITRLGGTVRELFVEGDRAVVYASTGATRPECTYAYDCEVAGDGSTTTVSVFDIGEPAHPTLLRKIDLSGSLLAARRIGNVVHTVVADGDRQEPLSPYPDDYQSCGEKESVVRAKFARHRANIARLIRSHASRLPKIAENGQKARNMCQGLYRTKLHDGDSFTSVVSFDLTSAAPATTASMQSRPGVVFASESGLYVAVTHRKSGKGWYPYYEDIDEASEIHRFAIGAAPSATRYAGSGTVPGHALNQFAMDEWNGYLRIATTRGRVPDPKVASEVSILATQTESGALTRVGALGNIAPGEDIRAVRFDDERAYVVTFKKTDPLFVIDTFEPQRPKILGELKIPGFSTYIHRIDPTHLMSIGFDANDHGSFAYFDGVILQLFDVTSPTDPRLMFKEKIGTRGSSSEAATNHLAFNWVPDEKLLALPMTICEGGGDGRNGDSLAFSGLLVYDVDLEHGFRRRGGVDHGKTNASCGTWWSQAKSHVKRSVFVDDLVYSIASDRMKVQRKSKLGTDVADLSLED